MASANRFVRVLCRSLSGLVLLAGMASQALSGDSAVLIRAPQFQLPGPGESGASDFSITLDAPPRDGCVSLAANRATLLISRRLLENIKAAGTATETFQPARPDLLRGGRAGEILAGLAATADEFGCFRAQPARSDYVYLVAELLNAGQLSVVDTASKRPVSVVEASYIGFRAGPTAGAGHVIYSYRLPADPNRPGAAADWVQFLSVDLWVS